jgi:gluconate 2-dehydrogenase gamma chain
MTKHDEARRAFLLGAAVGAGAVAGATLVPDALAQTHAPSTTGTGPAHSHAGGAGLGAFFNTEDAATVAAFTERLMPGAPGTPGARDADVLNYIDLALAGAYADLQYFYRRGLASLDAYCRKTYKEPFQRLSAAQQDEVIAALEQGKASEFSWPSAAAFFNTVRKECSPTRFTAATRTSLDGAWWDSPAGRWNSPRPTCRAANHSRGCPSSACRPRPADGRI